MMRKFLELVKEKAKEHPKRIVFPEYFDERTIQAVVKIAEEGTAVPVILGNLKAVKESFEKAGLAEAMTQFVQEQKLFLWDIEDLKTKERYTEALYELRKNKGLTKDETKKLIENFNYYAVMMVHASDVDGLITGANSPTSETLRPALQIIKTKEKFHKVSGFFFMALPEDPCFNENGRLLLFADCAVNIEPNSYELAQIAIDSAETAKRFGMEPRIAMLSFSTAGSAKHPQVDKVREAVSMVKYKRPKLIVDGEMQVDAALVPEVCARKYPNATIKGDANILIFPDLDSANISYKLVERLAHAQAIGPILQGLKKPVNDLSRGCSVDDIVNLAAITTVEALEISLPAAEKLKS